MGLESPQPGEQAPQEQAAGTPPSRLPATPPPPPLPPGSKHWGFYERISRLRHISRKNAARGTTLTNVAAGLVAGGSALGLISAIFIIPMLFLSAASISTSSGGGANSSDAALVFMYGVFGILSFLFSLAMGSYSFYVLSKASHLFTLSYQETMDLLRNRGLGTVVAQEDYIKHVQDELAERAWIRMVGRSSYHKFEEHLDYCACHFPALRKLAEGQQLNIWQLRREDNVFKSRKWFSQENWVYWTCGCLILAGSSNGNPLTLLFLIYLIMGGRYVVSRAVLVALCDFLLDPGVEATQEVSS